MQPLLYSPGEVQPQDVLFRIPGDLKAMIAAKKHLCYAAVIQIQLQGIFVCVGVPHLTVECVFVKHYILATSMACTHHLLHSPHAGILHVNVTAYIGGSHLPYQLLHASHTYVNPH